ncbi:hypothetical protein TIFTF001_055800 [Ficus carica]|uniref:Uncharacterized protein n=1 Tax=Ficus carica TaxID=3494 RepID=A0AA88EP34_FICCA|nr:hypothetical protein TIFTF001_055800 [Ficus carica]
MVDLIGGPLATGGFSPVLVKEFCAFGVVVVGQFGFAGNGFQRTVCWREELQKNEIGM